MAHQSPQSWDLRRRDLGNYHGGHRRFWWWTFKQSKIMKKKKENRKKTTNRRDQRTWWWRTFILSGNNYPGAEDVGLDVMIVDGNLEKKSGNVKKKDCRFAHQGHPTWSNQLLGHGWYTDISFCAHQGEDPFHKAMQHSNAYQNFYNQCSGLVLNSCLEIFWWQFPCLVSVGPLIT